MRLHSKFSFPIQMIEST